ncbi:acyltransferase family protein [Pseudomonas sp.]|uniref:acyltransferase family protein n=1 Tax=Pseudomonas sp. TaxID=306 RepID=UPI003BB5FA39
MKPAERISSLDGLRGLAILLVLFYHSWTILSGQKIMEGDVFILALLFAGNTGVTLFFLLSGFLVTRPFIENLPTGQLPSLRVYMAQRAIRILPTYYFVACAGLVITQQFEQLLPVLTFTASAYDVGYFSTVWWSLSTEIQFYILMPILFYLTCCAPSRVLGICILLTLVVVYVCIVLKVLGPSGNEGFEFKYRMILSVFGQMPAFLVGTAIALAYKKSQMVIPEKQASIFLLILMLCLILVLVPSAKIGPERYIWESPWYVLPEAGIWGGIMLVMLMRRAPDDNFINNRITRYFGKISFSLYLIHMPIIYLVLTHGNIAAPELATFLAIALSLVTAQFLYWTIEKPSLSLKNKLIPAPVSQGYKV